MIKEYFFWLRKNRILEKKNSSIEYARHNDALDVQNS